jgi:serine/threonine protein kinase/Tol biopolymer transport system component
MHAPLSQASPMRVTYNRRHPVTLSSGARLGPYEIVAPIGAGGMGEVYRARDTRLSREVAIKILPQSVIRDPEWLRRFQQEANAAGTLNHPNLVTIHDLGGQDDRPFIAMELLEGETLRAKLDEESAGARIPIRKAIDYSVQLANGLAAAHDKGIIHRDLKPENIFITRDGRVKILDFGLAKVTTVLEEARTQARGTTPGTVLGTVGYMSPEQVRGQNVDHRTDVFSFGAILYEMLSGRRAFHRNSAADTMSAILHEDPPELTGSNPNISPAIDRIIRHCLEKNPEERFQSAKDVAFDLQSISGLSGSAPAIAPVSIRSKAWIGLAAACLTGILIGIASMALLKRGGGAAPAPRTLRQLTFQGGVERYPSIAPDGKTYAFVSEASGNRDICVQRVDGRTAINLTKDSPLSDEQPAFSPDGEQIAFRSDRDGGGIFIMGATGESVRRLTDFGYNPAWSPDGSEIVVSTEGIDLEPRSRSGAGGLSIVDVKNGRVRPLTKRDAVQPSWSPHGDRIAYWGLVGGGGQRDIWTIAAHASDPEKTIVPVTSDPPLDWNPFWSADGKYLYFGSDRDGTMNLWRVRIDEKSGKTEGSPEPLRLPTEFAAHFSASRTNAIVFSSISSTYAVDQYPFDPATGSMGRSSKLMFSGSLPIAEFSVSPDGKKLVFRTVGSHEDLFVMNSDGSDLRQITNDPERDRGPSWSSDGKLIYFFSDRGGNYEVWSIRPDGSGLTQISRHSRVAPLFPRPSRDGSRLLTYNPTDGSYIFSLKDGRSEPLPRIDSQHLFIDPSWSPDGRSLGGLSIRTSDIRKFDGVFVYSLDARRYEKISDDPAAIFSSVQWLPDGKRVLYGYKNRIVLVDVATKQRREIPLPAAGEFGEFKLSPDGRALYVLTFRNEGDVWLMTDERAK